MPLCTLKNHGPFASMLDLAQRRRATHFTKRIWLQASRVSALHLTSQHIAAMTRVSSISVDVLSPESGLLIGSFYNGADHERVEGDVGMAGVAVDTVEDMKVPIAPSSTCS
jgi:methylmalonyl-CoA mutase N-terminal domain/subunit